MFAIGQEERPAMRRMLRGIDLRNLNRRSTGCIDAHQRAQRSGREENHAVRSPGCRRDRRGRRQESAASCHSDRSSSACHRQKIPTNGCPVTRMEILHSRCPAAVVPPANPKDAPRSQSSRHCLVAVNASIFPSGDSTGGPAASPDRFSTAFSGGLIMVRVTCVHGAGRVSETAASPMTTRAASAPQRSRQDVRA